MEPRRKPLFANLMANSDTFRDALRTRNLADLKTLLEQGAAAPERTARDLLEG